MDFKAKVVTFLWLNLMQKAVVPESILCQTQEDSLCLLLQTVNSWSCDRGSFCCQAK